MKKQFALTAVIAALFAAIGLYFGNLHSQAPPSQQPVTQKLFTVSLPDLLNHPQSLAQWKGKILLVNFWATWCAPCIHEIPDLSALQIQSKDGKLQIIGIGIDSASNIQEFSEKLKISYPLYFAGADGTALLRDLGDEGGALPFSVLIGSDGQLRKTYLGRLNMDEVRRDIEAQ